MRCLPRAPGARVPAADEPGQTSTGRPAGRRAASSMSHYWRVRGRERGGSRASKGSSVLQRSLWRCRRMRSTTRGSVIKETIRMRAPQVQSRGSASKDVVSYYTSRSICVAGLLARSLINDHAGCLPHVHLTIRGIIEPLVVIATTARLENAFPAPSPHDSF